MCGAGSSEARRTSGGNGEGDPPVPIPNTEVKPLCADGTWLETARESRSLPDPNEKRPDIRLGAQTVDKPKSTVIFHKEKRIIMSNI